MKKRLKGLKVKLVLGLASVMFAGGALLLNGCSNKSSEDIFLKDEFVLSVGDGVDVSNLINKNFNGTLVSSDENVLVVEDGKVKIISGGSAYIYAMQGRNRLAYVNVIVKDSFSVPSNIAIDKSGAITWNKSFKIIDGIQRFAKYQLRIRGGSFDNKIIDVNDNFFILSEQGVFDVSVRAVGDEFVDASNWSNVVKVYNYHVESAKEPSFVASEIPGQSKGVLSWSGDDNYYKIYVNNVSYETDNRRLELDLNEFNAGNYSINIESFDKDEKLMPESSETLVITKLEAPVINYSEGYFSWDPVLGASKYYVCYQSGSDVKGFYTTNTSTYLEGAEEGVYSVWVQAIGEGKVVSSAIKMVTGNTAKLGDFDVEFSKFGSVVDVSVITDSNYMKRFGIFVNGLKVDEISCQEKDGGGYEGTKSVRLNAPGVFKFQVQALPVYDNQNKLVEIGNSKYVTCSEFSQDYLVYKLDYPQNITHDLNELGQSIFEFDAIENADKFLVEINGKNVENISIESSDEERIKINAGVIDRNYYSITDGATVQVIITASKNEGNFVSASETKLLKVLNAPTSEKINKGYLDGNYYTWQNAENAGIYKCLIVKTTDDTYETEKSNEVYQVSDSSSNFITEGYYIIRVYSQSKNFDQFLDSKDYFEDKFMVAKQIDIPKITNFEMSGAYPVITFYVDPLTEQREYDRYFEVYLADEGSETLLASQLVSRNGGQYVYQFNDGIDYESSDKTIKIKLVCKDEVDHKIYLDSEFATLKIQKLQAPTISDISVSDDQNLSVALKGNASKVCYIFEGRKIVNDGQPVQVLNLKNYCENFIIKSKYITYTDYENEEFFTNGNYYVESDEFEIEFLRGIAPTNFKYEDGVVSYEEDAKLYNHFVLAAHITSLNDQEGKTFVANTELKTFNIDEMPSIFASYQDFESYFNQKTSMTLSVYSFKNEYDEEEGIYYLPSLNDVTADQGISTIYVTSLETVSDLSYKKSENKLAFTSTNPDLTTYYDIYLNGEILKTINIPVSTENDVSSYECSLDEVIFDAGQTKSFKVVARSRNYFNSNFSNEIVVERVSRLDQITVNSSIDDKAPKIVWNIPVAQRAKVKGVKINNQTFESFVGNALIDTNVSSYDVSLVAKDYYIDEDKNIKYYFMDSESSLFTLINAKNSSYVKDTKFENYALTWTSYPEIENYEDLFSYYVQANHSQTISRSKILLAKDSQSGSKNYISLSDEIFVGESELSEVNVYAFIGSYSLIKGGTGYYLCEKISTDNLNATRLNPVQNLSYELLDEGNTIEEEKQRKIKLVWDYETTEEVLYEISYNDYIGLNAKTTENKYIEISQSEFTEDTFVQVRVISKTNIPSKYQTTKIVLAKELSAYLSDDGMLTISDTENDNTYLICVDYNSNSFNLISNSKTIDIFETLKHIGNDDKDYLDVTISYVSRGKVDAILKINQDVSKRVLLRKSYKTFGNKIYFDASVADSVVVIYSAPTGNKFVTLSSKEIFCEVNDSQNGFVGLYSLDAVNDYGYSNLDQNVYFVFDVSSLEGCQNFVYYYKKSGYIDSWYDKTVSQNFETVTISNKAEISNINLKIENRNVIAAPQSSESISSLIVDVYYTADSSYYLGRFAFDGNTFNLNKISNVLNKQTLLAGNYTFNVYSTKLAQDLIVIYNSTNNTYAYEFAYSDSYDFEAEVLANEISSMHIDEKGMLAWVDQFENEYTIYQNNIYFDIYEESFDIRKLAKVEAGYMFEIAATGNLKFTDEGLSVNENQIVIPSLFKEVILPAELSEDFAIDKQPEATLKLTFEKEEINFDEISIFVEKENKVYKVQYKVDDQSSNVAYVKYISIYDEINRDFDEIDSINIFATQQGKVKTASKEISINILKNNSTIASSFTRIKSNDGKYDDLVEYQSLLSGVTSAWIKVLNSSAEEIFVGSVNFDSNKLNITDILADLAEEGASYSIWIAPVHVVDEQSIQIEWIKQDKDGEDLVYRRLLNVNNFKTYQDYVAWQKVDNNSGQYGYRFKQVAQVEEYKNLEIDQTQLDYSQFNKGVNLTLSIYTYSNEVGVISSKQQSIKAIRAENLNSSDFVVENGTLYLNWNENFSNIGKTFDQVLSEGNPLAVIKYIVDASGNVGNYTKTQAVDMLIYNIFKTPSYFTLKDISKAKITFNFKSGTNSNLVTVNLLQVLKPVSSTYINHLHAIANSSDITNDQKRIIENEIISIFVNNDKKYFTGIACDALLFDDAGSGAAEFISAGLYQINAWTNGNEDHSILRGEEATIFDQKEVLDVPVMQSYKEDISASTGVIYSNYFIKFKPIKDNQGVSKTEYRLVLNSTVTSADNIYFDVEKSGTNWIIYIDTEDYITLEVDANGYILIPINTRGSHRGIDELFDIKADSYNASIYAKGNSSQLNGKSDLIRITFLSIKEIYLNLGQLSWTAYNLAGQSYTTRVIYQKENSVDYIIQNVDPRNTGSFDLSAVDNYKFLTFMTVGGIANSGYEILVDSEVLMIKNISKLSAPNLSTNDGAIVIYDTNNYNSSDYERKYIVQNNKSGIKYLITENKDKTGYYNPGELYGNEDLTKTYRETEFEASIFYFENAGTDATLTPSEELETTSFFAGYDLGKVRVLRAYKDDSSRIYLRSEKNSISGIMLEETSVSVNPDTGDITWNKVSKDIFGLYPELDQTKVVVYKAIIEFYRETDTLVNSKIYQLEPQYTQTIYTDQTEISADVIQTPIDTAKRAYKISVTAMVYDALTGTDSITTIEGSTYYKLLGEQAKYDDSYYILRSGHREVNGFLTRMTPVTDVKVNENGMISWNYTDRADYFVYASSTGDMLTNSIELQKETITLSNGVATFNPSNVLDKNTPYYIFVKTYDKTGESLPSLSVRSDRSYYKLPDISDEDFEVNYTKNYAGKTIYTIDLSGYKDKVRTEGGSKNYFYLLVKVSTSKDIYKDVKVYPDNMIMRFIVDTGQSNAENKIFYLNGANGVKLDITAVQDSSKTVKIMNSETTENIEFNMLSFTDYDDIIFNEEEKSIQWTYNRHNQHYLSQGTILYYLDQQETMTQFETLSQEVYCEVYDETFEDYTKVLVNEQQVYVKTAEIKNKLIEEPLGNTKFDVEVVYRVLINETKAQREELVITRKYYNVADLKLAPDVIGTIERVSIQAKGGAKDFASEALSKELEAKLDIYKSGQGTEDNPFLISSANEFNNISLRAIKDASMVDFKETIYTRITSLKDGTITNGSVSDNTPQKVSTGYYFKQEKDLILSVEGFVIDQLNGVYDGAGYKLTVNGRDNFATMQAVKDESSSNSFTNGFALIKNLTGTLKNVLLDFTYDYYLTDNLLVSSLVFVNNGIIDNVEITSFAFNFRQGVKASGKLGVSGVVAINNQIVSNSKNSAKITIENKQASQSSSKQYFSGLVLVNNGLVYACENSEEIKLSVTASSNVNIYLGGVVCINQSGNLERVSNIGDITVTNSNGSSFVGGIVYYSNSGSLRYSYNTGNISAGKGAGIAYRLNSTAMYYNFAYGSVNNSVNSYNFFNSSYSSLGSNNYNYTYPSYSNNRWTFTNLQKVNSAEVEYATVSNLIEEKTTGKIKAEINTSTNRYTVEFVKD